MSSEECGYVVWTECRHRTPKGRYPMQAKGALIYRGTAWA